ncbi:MAG: glycosyltransferase family 9 protein [Candidatus Cloacimonetes bacterium]|nr:glycosyltransferase family 9 protein [Candidatus Cloacimonadota bacterium]
MKILLLQLAKMGDLLQTAPLLRRLQDAHLGAEVHLLHSAMFASVAARLGADRCLPVDLDSTIGADSNLRQGTHAFLVQLQQAGYGLVVNPSSGRLAGQIAGAVGAPVLGYAGQDPGALAWLYFALSFIRSRRLATLNLTDIYRQLLPQAGPSAPVRQRTSWGQCSLIGFQLASRNRKRQWPLAQFAALADRLVESGTRIRLLGSEAEAAHATSFLKQVGNPERVENLVGRTDVPGLFTAVKECDLLVTGDTGTMHVAAALDVPVTAVFLGPASPWETLAWSEHAEGFWPERSAVDCYPCLETAACDNGFACHGSVNAEDIWSRRAGNAARFATTARDALGQVLTPNGGLVDDEKMGMAYRAWACEYFLDAPCEASPLPELLVERLRRELRLWERLQPRQMSPEHLAPSFELLLPLVYFTHLCRHLQTDAPDLLGDWLRTAAGL